MQGVKDEVWSRAAPTRLSGRALHAGARGVEHPPRVYVGGPSGVLTLGLKISSTELHASVVFDDDSGRALRGGFVVVGTDW